MKKLFLLIFFTAIFFTPLFAQNEPEENTKEPLPKKHQQMDMYFGFSAGAAGMKTSEHGIFTANLGVAYGFYLHKWVSLNTGLLFHTEFYSGHNLLTNSNPMAAPFCFTLPFGLHFNIPGVEWIYTGVNIAINIPIANLKSSGDHDAFSGNNIFISMPIDFGFDFIQAGKGGSRAFIRITPTFHSGGFIVPVGLVWQIYNWKVFAQKVEVEVKVPPPPTPPRVIVIY